MKSCIRSGSPDLSRAVQTYAEWLRGEVEAKNAEIGRHRSIAAHQIKASDRAVPTEVGAMMELLDRIAPTNARVLESLEHESEAIQGAMQSFFGLAQVLATDREDRITVASARRLELGQRDVLGRIHQIRRALEASPDCGAIKIFPHAQLEAIAAEAGKKIDHLQSVAGARCKRTLERALRPDEVREPKDAAHWIAQRLGEPELAERLLAIDRSLDDASEFRANLSAMAILADEAIHAPDYARTQMGWHHPNARSAYRRREHGAISRYQSEQRQEKSRATLAAGLTTVLEAGDPQSELDRLLVESFIREIGVSRRTSSQWNPNASAVRRALAHEAFLPLRALNETVRDMSPRPELIGEFETAVQNITRHVVEGDYRRWRYDNPISAAQLAGLGDEPKRDWQQDFSTTHRVGDVVLKTREEDDLDLLWLTKIGGPSHGFDYGGRCLLPLLSNGRTKAIVVDDERWPHNAVARSYLRILHFEDGSPTLYLEPFQRDFPHRAEFQDENLDAELYRAIISHAKQRADQLGLPLSIGTDYRSHLDALGIPVESVTKSLVIRASNGVYEASDTLGLGHDWHQQRDMTTPALLRLEYRS